MAELLDMPDEYTKAVEAAIGAQQQHVVVTDEAAGKAAIDISPESVGTRYLFTVE